VFLVLRATSKIGRLPTDDPLPVVAARRSAEEPPTLGHKGAHRYSQAWPESRRFALALGGDLPRHHEVRLSDIDPDRMSRILLAYGEFVSVRDPVSFSFAHGGKDGTPFPVDRQTYDATVESLHRAVSEAMLGRNDKVETLRRLARLPPGAGASG
jgi:hypothetical protein